jgi:hypothetical protein
VHRKLGPAVGAVGSARQSWKLIGLSRTAGELLGLVDNTDRIRTQSVRVKRKFGKTIGDAARELETKASLHSQEIHTETGAHAKSLERGYSGAKGREDAKKRLEEILADLNRQFEAKGSLPWSQIGLIVKRHFHLVELSASCNN